MKFKESITINASAEKIFQLYENVAEWYIWDKEVQSSSIEGDFKVGAKGKLKPKKGLEADIKITEISKPTSFTVTSKLPLCLMIFEHKLIAKGEETEVIHAVSFKGKLAFLFGRLIGKEIKKGLPTTLKGLKETAELRTNEIK